MFLSIIYLVLISVLRNLVELLLPKKLADSLFEEKDATHQYSSVTLRRAVALWLNSGQLNYFPQICNYVHHLEALEKTKRHYVASCVRVAFKSPKRFQCIQFPKIDEDVTAEEVFYTCNLVRKYCVVYLISMSRLLEQYEEYIITVKRGNTLEELSRFVKSKFLQKELSHHFIINDGHIDVKNLIFSKYYKDPSGYKRAILDSQMSCNLSLENHHYIQPDFDTRELMKSLDRRYQLFSTVY